MTALRRITSSGLVALFALSCSGIPSLTNLERQLGAQQVMAEVRLRAA